MFMYHSANTLFSDGYGLLSGIGRYIRAGGPPYDACRNTPRLSRGGSRGEG